MGQVLGHVGQLLGHVGANFRPTIRQTCKNASQVLPKAPIWSFNRGPHPQKQQKHMGKHMFLRIDKASTLDSKLSYFGRKGLPNGAQGSTKGSPGEPRGTARMPKEHQSRSFWCICSHKNHHWKSQVPPGTPKASKKPKR